jgi:hypothetical protein
MIQPLNSAPDLVDGSKQLQESYNELQKLLLELKGRNLPRAVIDLINTEITRVNDSGFTKKSIQKATLQVLSILEEELDLVPKSYYRRKWLALGIATFGIPIGVVIGLSLGNIGLLGIGLPIGLVIGIAVGDQKDKKALEEGKQLNF